MLLRKPTKDLPKDKSIKDEYLEKMNWRYATKSFSGKEIPASDIEMMKEILRLSPSSYGLQPYHFIFIKDKKVREELFSASYGQPQIKDCSHLVVICSKQGINSVDINNYIDLIVNTRKVDRQEVKPFQNMIESAVLNMNTNEQSIWASKQAYIALGNLLSACALFDIDACPMETFQTEKFDSILQLEQKGLSASVLAALGYRSKSDSYQHKQKVRKPLDQLISDI